MAIRIGDIRTAGTSYAELDDKMLVLDFQAGQPQAFVEIHRRYGPLAKHVCRRFLPNAHDADEAFQETMIRVFQGLFRFNGQFALQPWIARIATNVSLDQIRARARRPQVDDDSIEAHDREDDSDTPDRLVERLLERDLVLAVLSELPASHRQALVLRELEGRSHKDIAESMGITPSQAKALIHRAKGSFRRTWLLKATERGGALGVALLPLAWLLRASEALKRFGDRAVNVGQAAQATTPELVATTATVSTPVTTGLVERAVAAGVTILVAGGVTVGAVSVSRNRDPQPVHDRAAVAAPAADREARAEEREESVTASRREEPREKPDRGHHAGPTVEEARPTPSPAPDPTDAPVEPTEPPPTDEPSETPPPVVAAPAFGFELHTGTVSEERCECAPARVVGNGRVTGEAPDLSFAVSIEGAALDGSGAAAWPLSLDLAGTLTADGGDMTIAFLLGPNAEASTYNGTATLVSSEPDGDWGTIYRFSGSYAPLVEVRDGRPTGGDVSAAIGVWSDGTIYLSTLQLS